MMINCVDCWLPQRIDFPVLRKNGISLVCPKASQGAYVREDGSGYSEDFKDPMFDEHMQKAVMAKIPVMPWHFFTATTKTEAKRQAKYFLNVIKPYRAYVAYVALDCEVYTMSRQAALSRTALTDLCEVFLKACEKDGYLPVFYTNPDHVQNRIDEIRLWNYPKWVAFYGQRDPMLHGQIIWQSKAETMDGVRDQFGSPIPIDCNFHSLPEFQTAILSLAEKGFLLSPAYWIKTAPTIRYLPELFIKADRKYSFRWKQSTKVEWALSKLKADGVITSPDYWLSVKNKNVRTLLKNLGGGQT